MCGRDVRPLVPTCLLVIGKENLLNDKSVRLPHVLIKEKNAAKTHHYYKVV